MARSRRKVVPLHQAEESPPVAPAVLDEKSRISFPIIAIMGIVGGVASFVFTAGMVYQGSRSQSAELDDLKMKNQAVERRIEEVSTTTQIRLHDLCRATQMIQVYTVPSRDRVPISCEE